MAGDVPNDALGNAEVGELGVDVRSGAHDGKEAKLRDHAKKGDDVEARIVFACDAFAAMTAERPYRTALELGEALAELERCAGTQFDPEVVAALVTAVGAHSRSAAAG